MRFLRGQKELEVIFIKKIFGYKLSMSKCLLTVSWAELGITTVDTLLSTYVQVLKSQKARIPFSCFKWLLDEGLLGGHF